MRPDRTMNRMVALATAASMLAIAGLALDAERTPAGVATARAAGDADPQRQRFDAGGALFRQHWTVAPSAFGVWGRGPLSNAEACSDCHEDNGRGRPPLAPDEPLRSMLLRLSVGAGPHPIYGDQLQHQGVLGRVPGEGEAYVTWHESAVALDDGEVVSLRHPEFRLTALRYGPIEADTHLSARVAPALQGLGLLEAVPVAALEAIARDQRRLGVAGRINHVPAAAAAPRAGRFGLKASQPSLREQIAVAAHADLGLTSASHPEEDCTPAQRACRAFPRAAAVELSGEQIDAIELYLQLLPPPARRHPDAPDVLQGERLFRQAGCDLCHVPALRTAADAALPALRAQSVQAYTDLMLHDLGDALADGTSEHGAGPRDWRTAPLWGLGQAGAGGARFLLHDGRARSLPEAILWHGGQAHAAREAYRRMRAQERQALAAFLESL